MTTTTATTDDLKALETLLEAKFASLFTEFKSLADSHNALVTQLKAEGVVLEDKVVAYVATEKGLFRTFLQKAEAHITTIKNDVESEFSHLFHSNTAAATPTPTTIAAPVPAEASGASAAGVAAGSTSVAAEPPSDGSTGTTPPGEAVAAPTTGQPAATDSAAAPAVAGTPSTTA